LFAPNSLAWNLFKQTNGFYKRLEKGDLKSKYGESMALITKKNSLQLRA